MVMGRKRETGIRETGNRETRGKREMREKGNQPTETTVQKQGCREKAGKLNFASLRGAFLFFYPTPHTSALYSVAAAHRAARLSLTRDHGRRTALQDGVTRWLL